MLFLLQSLLVAVSFLFASAGNGIPMVEESDVANLSKRRGTQRRKGRGSLPLVPTLAALTVVLQIAITVSQPPWI